MPEQTQDDSIFPGHAEHMLVPLCLMILPTSVLPAHSNTITQTGCSMLFAVLRERNTTLRQLSIADNSADDRVLQVRPCCSSGVAGLVDMYTRSAWAARSSMQHLFR